MEIIGDNQQGSGNGSGALYVTRTGKRKHREECRHLRRSKIAAPQTGRGPCKHCRP